MRHSLRWRGQGDIDSVAITPSADFDRLVSEGATVADDSPELGPEVSTDSRDQFARAVQSARDVLGRLTAARRGELAVALQELVQAGDQLLQALDAHPGRTPSIDGDGASDSSP